MRFAYYYKTSDGVRNEAFIESPTRDAAFGELRSRGIRPIKVVSCAGTKANGEERVVTRKRFVFVALVLGLLSGVFIAVVCARVDWRDKRIVAIERNAKEILADHNKRMSDAGALAISDLGTLANVDRRTEMRLAVEAGYKEISKTRKAVRDLFSAVCRDVAIGTGSNWGLADDHDKEYREAIRGVYFMTMDALDLSAARHEKAERLFNFLDANRSGWKVDAGRLVVIDERLRDDVERYYDDVFQ